MTKKEDILVQNESAAEAVGDAINTLIDYYDIRELYLTGYDPEKETFGVFIYGPVSRVSEFLEKAKARVADGEYRA